MTYTTKNPAASNIPNHNGCNFSTREETKWPAFDQNNEYCGEIRMIRAWQVPASVHKSLGLRGNLDLYVTSEGHWASTREIAEHLLANTPPAQSLIVKGATLSFFVPPQWAEGNGGSTKAYGDCQVFRTATGGWDAQPIRVDQGLAHDAATF
jgi:hypothetical protein